MKRTKQTLRDIDGKEIAGYRYGTYWLQATGKGRIAGLSASRYNSEVDLLRDYDNANGQHSGAPKLKRVYIDGTEVQLRPVQEGN